METDPALDHAIDLATDRTHHAQVELTEAIDPPLESPSELPEKAEVVVHRAEDLHILTEEATGDPDATS
jgi:hypothetical protein